MKEYKNLVLGKVTTTKADLTEAITFFIKNYWFYVHLQNPQNGRNFVLKKHTHAHTN